MENERPYRKVFYAECGRNFLVTLPIVFLVGCLPTMIDTAALRYSVFIYFNLMTMVLLGCLQFTVACHLHTAKPSVKVPAWSTILLVLLFLATVVFLPMPVALREFVLPSMAIGLMVGLLFCRYLHLSAVKTTT